MAPASGDTPSVGIPSDRMGFMTTTAPHPVDVRNEAAENAATTDDKFESEAAAWVRLVARRLETSSLSQREYNRHRPSGAPAARTIIRHTRSWVSACEAAGLEAGMPTPTRWDERSRINALRCAAEDIDGPFTAAKYGRWRLEQDDPFEWPSIAQFIGRTEPTDSAWRAWCAKAGITPAVKRRPLKFSDEEMLGALRRCAADRPVSERNNPLTESAYIEWSRSQPGRLPHRRTFALRYGSWRNAVENACLRATPRSGEGLTDALEAIRLASGILGTSQRSPLSAADYERWANGQPNHPSLSTIIRKYGSWRVAVATAQLPAHQPGSEERPASPTDAWAEPYSALADFAAREGHVRVPAGHVEAGRRNLSAWVARQRSRYRRAKLTAEQISRLEALPGWQWEPQKQR